MADPNEEQAKPDEANEPVVPTATAGSEPVDPPKRAKKKAEAGEFEPGGVRDRNRRIREEAAEKRRAKREAEARRAAPARNLDASEIVDDALVRGTHTLGNWLKRNINVIQYVVIGGVVAGLGYQIYSYRKGITADRAAEELTRAQSAEFARVGPNENPEPDRYSGLSDTRQEFATDAARLSAAEAEYRKAESATKGASSTLATLGLAGVLFDQGKYKDAEAAYQKVKTSALAAKDGDVRGRSLEGLGLAQEAQNKLDPALASFRELANSDIAGLKDFGTYHQARVLTRKGERDKAKELLKPLVEKLSKKEGGSKSAFEPTAPSYLEAQARELLASVDPTALPKTPVAGAITPEQIEALKAQLKLQGDGKLDPEKLEEMLRGLQAPGGGAPAPAPTTPPAEGSAP